MNILQISKLRSTALGAAHSSPNVGLLGPFAAMAGIAWSAKNAYDTREAQAAQTEQQRRWQTQDREFYTGMATPMPGKDFGGVTSSRPGVNSGLSMYHSRTDGRTPLQQMRDDFKGEWWKGDLSDLNFGYNGLWDTAMRQRDMAQYKQQLDLVSPEAQRQRLEQAGYNPFLSDLDSTTGNLTSRASSDMSSGASGAPQMFSPYSDTQTPQLFSQFGTNMASQMQAENASSLSQSQKEGQDINNQLNRFRLNTSIEGIPLGVMSDIKNFNDAKLAFANSKFSTAQATAQELENIARSRVYTDEEGGTKLDADGNVMNVADVDAMTKARLANKEIQKIISDINEGQSRINLNKYNLDNILPEVRTQIQKSVEAYNSQMELNRYTMKLYSAEAFQNYAAGQLSMAYKNTEDYTRDQKRRQAYWDATTSKYRAKQGYLDWKVGKAGLPGELYYQNLNNNKAGRQVDYYLDKGGRLLGPMAQGAGIYLGLRGARGVKHITGFR